ncbi:MAG: hypothetical protein IJD64_03140 [Clostridia bacterium]|nr:hypothetical protein [Clostridia bacterium]
MKGFLKLLCLLLCLAMLVCVFAACDSEETNDENETVDISDANEKSNGKEISVDKLVKNAINQLNASFALKAEREFSLDFTEVEEEETTKISGTQTAILYFDKGAHTSLLSDMTAYLAQTSTIEYSYGETETSVTEYILIDGTLYVKNTSDDGTVAKIKLDPSQMEDYGLNEKLNIKQYYKDFTDSWKKANKQEKSDGVSVDFEGVDREKATPTLEDMVTELLELFFNLPSDTTLSCEFSNVNGSYHIAHNGKLMNYMLSFDSVITSPDFPEETIEIKHSESTKFTFDKDVPDVSAPEDADEYETLQPDGPAAPVDKIFTTDAPWEICEYTKKSENGWSWHSEDLTEAEAERLVAILNQCTWTKAPFVGDAEYALAQINENIFIRIDYDKASGTLILDLWVSVLSAEDKAFIDSLIKKFDEPDLDFTFEYDPDIYIWVNFVKVNDSYGYGDFKDLSSDDIETLVDLLNSLEWTKSDVAYPKAPVYFGAFSNASYTPVQYYSELSLLSTTGFDDSTYIAYLSAEDAAFLQSLIDSYFSMGNPDVPDVEKYWSFAPFNSENSFMISAMKDSLADVFANASWESIVTLRTLIDEETLDYKFTVSDYASFWYYVIYDAERGILYDFSYYRFAVLTAEQKAVIEKMIELHLPRDVFSDEIDWYAHHYGEDPEDLWDSALGRGLFDNETNCLLNILNRLTWSNDSSVPTFTDSFTCGTSFYILYDTETGTLYNVFYKLKATVSEEEREMLNTLLTYYWERMFLPPDSFFSSERQWEVCYTPYDPDSSDVTKSLDASLDLLALCELLNGLTWEKLTSYGSVEFYFTYTLAPHELWVDMYNPLQIFFNSYDQTLYIPNFGIVASLTNEEYSLVAKLLFDTFEFGVLDTEKDLRFAKHIPISETSTRFAYANFTAEQSNTVWQYFNQANTLFSVAEFDEDYSFLYTDLPGFLFSYDSDAGIFKYEAFSAYKILTEEQRIALNALLKECFALQKFEEEDANETWQLGKYREVGNTSYASLIELRSKEDIRTIIGILNSLAWEDTTVLANDTTDHCISYATNYQMLKYSSQTGELFYRYQKATLSEEQRQTLNTLFETYCANL